MKDPTKINVLVACEESQRVCMAFRDKAAACDEYVYKEEE